jgi:hypothetical protein
MTRQFKRVLPKLNEDDHDKQEERELQEDTNKRLVYPVPFLDAVVQQRIPATMEHKWRNLLHPSNSQASKEVARLQAQLDQWLMCNQFGETETEQLGKQSPQTSDNVLLSANVIVVAMFKRARLEIQLALESLEK